MNHRIAKAVVVVCLAVAVRALAAEPTAKLVTSFEAEQPFKTPEEALQAMGFDQTE